MADTAVPFDTNAAQERVNKAMKVVRFRDFTCRVIKGLPGSKLGGLAVVNVPAGEAPLEPETIELLAKWGLEGYEHDKDGITLVFKLAAAKAPGEKRARRTKAEIEADKAKTAAPAAPVKK